MVDRVHAGHSILERISIPLETPNSDKPMSAFTCEALSVLPSRGVGISVAGFWSIQILSSLAPSNGAPFETLLICDFRGSVVFMISVPQASRAERILSSEKYAHINHHTNLA